MGSALRIPVLEMSREELLMRVGQQLYVCDMDGKSLHSMAPPAWGIIILGNESLGVSDELMHKVKEKIAVSGQWSKGAESLNVGSAAAIVAAWWRGGISGLA